MNYAKFMIMSVSCPQTDQLQDYWNGSLNETDSITIESHLSTCATCEQTASEY